jgi:hypothetical protein
LQDLGSLGCVAGGDAVGRLAPDASKDRVAFTLKGGPFNKHNSSWTARTVKMTTFLSFETPTAIHPATQLRNQQHYVPLFVSVSGGGF